MKLDILVFSPHPDDAELGCGGTIASHVKKGYKTGIIDLTQGELGTRGSIEIRSREAERAAEILGVAFRDNLKLKDGFFSIDEEACMKVIQVIRKYQPEIIFANAPFDRHPDHGRGAELVSRAGFLSGLTKIKTFENGIAQEAWRASHIFNYIQDRFLKPDFAIDITGSWEKKKEALLAFTSQFYDPANKTEPVTYISTPEFIHFVEARAIETGHSIQVKYAEGFLKQSQIGIKDIMSSFI